MWEAFLYRLCVFNAFGRRAGFDIYASHLFPQGVLAAITLVEVALEMQELEEEMGVRWHFPLLTGLHCL